jgi:O-antigen/teichoic acid export membrane protein
MSAQGALVTIGAIQVATVAFQVVRSKITAEAAGPSGVGVISVIDQVVLFIAQLSNLSLPFAAGKFLAAAHAKSRDQYAQLYVGLLRVLTVFSVLGTVLAILLVFVRPTILGTELAGYRSLVILAFLAIPVMNLTSLLIVALSAVHRVRAAALFGFVSSISLALIAGGGILLAGLYGYYLSQLMMSFILLVAGMWYLMKMEPLPLRRMSCLLLRDIRSSVPLVSLAGALCLTSLTSPLADLVARSAVLREGGLPLLGLFQAALGLAVLLRTTVRSTFSLFLIPAINRQFDSQAKLAEAADFMLALSRTLGIIALPLVLFPDWCLILAYSKAFVLAAPVLCLFTLAIIIQLLAAVNQALLVGLDCTATYLWTSLIADFTEAGLALYLTPFLGIIGVPLAYLSASSLLFVLTAYLLHCRHRTALLHKVGWLPVYVVIAICIGSASALWLDLPLYVLLPVRLALWLTLSLPLLMAKPSRGIFLEKALAFHLPNGCCCNGDRLTETGSEKTCSSAAVSC